MLKKILIAVALVVVAFVAFVAARPNEYRVERAREINAPASIVYSQVSDFRAWSRWSPWEKLDPSMKKTFMGTPFTVGSSYEWVGNDKVGSGKMTIIEAKESASLSTRLEFKEPFASVARNGFRFEPHGASTKVTWWMEGENNFVGKVFGLFMDMDEMIGKDFEQGLADLSVAAEAEAKNAQAKNDVAPPAAPQNVPSAAPAP